MGWWGRSSGSAEGSCTTFSSETPNLQQSPLHPSKSPSCRYPQRKPRIKKKKKKSNLSVAAALPQAGPSPGAKGGGSGQPPHHTCLSGRGLPAEELVVEGAVGRVEPGLQEDAAIGDGLQRGRALVGEPEADEELQGTNPVLVSDFFFFSPTGKPPRQPASIPSLPLCSCTPSLCWGSTNRAQNSPCSMAHSSLCTAMGCPGAASSLLVLTTIALALRGATRLCQSCLGW